MNDNDLIRIISPIIQNGLTNDGYINVTVKSANQPTQQGANSNPTIYFYKLYDKRYGFLKRNNQWGSIQQKMIDTEVQLYETSFQINAWVRQRPTTPYQYTASDLVNEVAAIMQSDATRETLRLSNIGILRILDVRNPYFTDDRDQFEASPSFDFTLTHRQTRTTEQPVIDLIDLDIKRV